MTPQEILVSLRDGVQLATDVYLPAGHPSIDCFPAALVRVPYGKRSRYTYLREAAQRFAAHGYAVVVQDVRGKFASGGLPVGPTCEAADGWDTIEWITHQPWSNGAVGMFGDSYYGFTQWAAVSSGHPALKAIAPRMTTFTMAEMWHRRRDGLPDVPWNAFAAYVMQCWTRSGMDERLPRWNGPPLLDSYAEMFAELRARSPWFDALIPSPTDMTYLPVAEPLSSPPVPTLHLVGWYDNLAIAHMRDVAHLLQHPTWGPMQYLRADSVDHESYHLDDVPITPATDHVVDDSALEALWPRYLDPVIEFFDVFVKDPEHRDDYPRVRWHLGHVGMRQAESWPPPEAEPVQLYLRQSTTDGATLSLSPPLAEESAQWEHDPASPVPSAVRNSFAYLAEYPDEQTTTDRTDVLTFSSPVLHAPCDIVGAIELHVRITTTAPSTDLFVRLLDVAPGGAAHLVVRGQGVLGDPGEDMAVVELGSTGYRVRAGHKLRLHICSSDVPEYVVNPGTAENRWTAATWSASTQQLTTGPGRSAYLHFHALPTIEDPPTARHAEDAR